jgi:hypothetical protein
LAAEVCAQELRKHKIKQKRGISDSWGIVDDPATLFQNRSYPAPFFFPMPALRPAKCKPTHKPRRRYASSITEDGPTEDDTPDQDADYFSQKNNNM